MSSKPLSGKPHLGVLFDIDALGGGFYGQAAYEWLFCAVGPANRLLMAGCLMLDGDTNETLAGHARWYCIAVTSDNAQQIADIRRCVEKKHVRLLGLPYESPTLENEPLVLAVRFALDGTISWCETPWIVAAWSGIFELKTR